MIHTIYLFLLTIFLISGMASPRAAEGLTSYIDDDNRFILNGEPFFPIGLYVVQCTNGSYSAELDEIANSPFDTMMNYGVNQCGTDATDAQILDYLNQLESKNLKLIFSLTEYFDNGQADIDTITHKVSTFKDRPALISWYLNDERDPATYLTQLEERYAKIRKLDDNHPVWSVHWNTDWLLPEAHTTDILGMDSYPIAHLPITEVSRVADAAAQVGAQTDKPFWLVPQIFDWSDYPGDPAGRDLTGRPPTREEMRAMTYLAVNHGAKGLIYYSYFNIVDDPDYATRWPQIKEIASEIDQLRPVFLSTYQTNDDDIVCDNADIDFKLMREGDTYYLFAVNTKEEDITGVSFEINLTQKPAVFGTLFEDGRQISVTDGKVTDDFDVYEVHVYYWEEPESDEVDTGGGGSSGGCFIATAAFGSYVDPYVQVLRDFRDECLITNIPGRWFVNIYNTYGPLWADRLHAHPGCKPFVRLALMPVVGISYFVLNTSLATKLLAGFLLLGFIPISLLRLHGRSATRE